MEHTTDHTQNECQELCEAELEQVSGGGKATENMVGWWRYIYYTYGRGST